MPADARAARRRSSKSRAKKPANIRRKCCSTKRSGPLEYINQWIKIARRELKPKKLPVSAIAFPGKRAELSLLPRGVVGVIAPWNFPLGEFFRPVFPALLAGNAVITKPSEHTPQRSGAWFAQVMNEFLPPQAC